jgi:DNA invertase Pin-like site-specific DNA recombinase
MLILFQIGACYIRVSTDDQLEYSPDAQLKAIKDYAKKNDIVLNKEFIFIDEGISGRKAEKRPEFMRMIATAKMKPKPFDVILVHKFDRFARSREDSVVYKSLLKKEAGIRVVSISESIEDDKFSVILEAMLEAMAEYYSLNLSDEVKKGMTEKAGRGEYQTTPPFGYNMENGKLLINQEEAAIVRFIFEQFASRQMTMRILAIYVNEKGIRSKRGNIFENRSIDYILNNPVYIGKVRWTPTGKTRRNFHNPDSIISDSDHEPIISLKLWDEAQEVIRENKELYPKNIKTTTKMETWLKGLAKCGNCGKTLVQSREHYLQCNGYNKGQCKISCSVKSSILEEIVLGEVQKAFTDEINLEIVPKSSNESLKSEYELLKVALEKFQLKFSRIKIAYEDGIDTLEEYKENKKRLEADFEATKKQLNVMEQELLNPSGGDTEPIIKRIESAYSLLSDANIDLETKYQVAHFLIEKVTYTKQEKTLKIVYK